MWNILRTVAETYEDIKNKIENHTGGEGALASNPSNVINAFLYVGGIVAIVMIIVAGVQMTTSAGNPSAVAKAKTTMIWAIVGLLVMVLAYAIVNFVIFRVTNG